LAETLIGIEVAEYEVADCELIEDGKPLSGVVCSGGLPNPRPRRAYGAEERE
jgi:hypothetical protein